MIHWPSIFANMSKSMNQLVAEFPAQLREAMAIADGFRLKSKRPFEHVLICGLGGSGIGGSILAQLIAEECQFPVLASKDYTVPEFVDPKTLVIACSYSGNTEETLEALDSAVAQGAQIACITSGGKLLEMAQENNWPCIKIPSGYPPRSAFGFSIVQLFKLASEFGMIATGWKSDMEKAIAYLEANQDEIQRAGLQLAEGLQHKMPVIYSSSWLEGVSTRWRQQINENAKKLAWHHYYPEMNHNELVGWRNKNHDLAVVLLTSNFDHDRVTRRMELSQSVFMKLTPHVHHCSAIGGSKIEQAIYLIHLGDFMSVELADLNGTDSTEVDVIDWLKDELSKF